MSVKPVTIEAATYADTIQSMLEAGEELNRRAAVIARLQMTLGIIAATTHDAFASALARAAMEDKDNE